VKALFIGGTKDAYAHRPAHAPDGTFVFEGNPVGVEEIFRVSRGGVPALISPNYEDDNSPCVLRNGMIASF
jgi:hypothetical protein